MRKLIIFSALVLTILNANSQNVGIGTNTPTYPLTVIASSSKGIIQKDGAMEVGFYTTSTAAYLQTWTNHPLHFATNNGNAQLTLTTNGNFGVGTLTPSTKLHVSGNTSLIGDVGINTTSPTADLDLNGTLRLRGSSPTAGAVLTSADANGNAEWARPIAFKATGGYDGLANTISNNTWTKIFFNQTASYNLGLNYQPINSQFVAGENGIYHFDTQIHWDELLGRASVKICLNRSGVISTIAENYHDADLDLENGTVRIKHPLNIGTDVSLVTGDIVWVEAWAIIGYQGGSTTTVNAFSFYTWFNGHLITRN